MKIDGRTLRRDIKNYLNREELEAEFTVGTVWIKETISRSEPYLQAYFTDVDWDTCEKVTNFINSEWWPENYSKATIRYRDDFGTSCTRNYRGVEIVQGAFCL